MDPLDGPGGIRDGTQDLHTYDRIYSPLKNSIRREQRFILHHGMDGNVYVLQPGRLIDSFEQGGEHARIRLNAVDSLYGLQVESRKLTTRTWSQLHDDAFGQSHQPWDWSIVLFILGEMGTLPVVQREVSFLSGLEIYPNSYTRSQSCDPARRENLWSDFPGDLFVRSSVFPMCRQTTGGKHHAANRRASHGSA